MQIKYHKNFQKSFKKRIAPYPKLVAQFQKHLTLFIENPENPTLKDHKLVGQKLNLRAFSVTGDIRVVYKKVKDELWLFDIGSHNQVY